MLQVVLWVIIGLIVAILFFATTKPDEFRIHRHADIKAPRDKIFPFLNDFHEWKKWSPWETLDTDLARKYDGPDHGVGAHYEWQGQKAGEGSMDIMEEVQPAELLINLNFEKPMKAKNRVEFVLTDDGGGATRVDWTMRGRNSYVNKVFQTFVSMDKLVGKDFEKGLAQLKTVAEKR